MDKITDKQLEQKAEVFVGEYKNASDDEISKIVAGMTAIIEGNEAAYESMKNQKWFERIWYGLTLKNKATVKEMQQKREMLTKYTVQILVKMNSLMNEHSECIYDLYRALSVVRRDLDIAISEVNSLAHKLNEKINSIDNYYYLLNEIRNNKFDINSPLVSLIDIMSMIDNRTANDTKKLRQLKETMEAVGFNFSEKIDIPTFSNDILNISEDKVGRILLFCQSFSDRSRFLSYTCALMENYFYLWESDRRVIKENGEAVSTALECARLTTEASCIVGEMFNDLENAIHERTEFIEIPNIPVEPTTPANYFSTLSTRTVNVILAGMTGSGKSTLCNSIFGWNVAATGRGSAVTMQICKYSNDKDNINIFDTAGFELMSPNNDVILSEIENVARNTQNCVLWYCINSLSSKYEDYMLKKLYSLGLPTIIVLTSSVDADDDFETSIRKINSHNELCNIPVVPVLAKDYIFKGDDGTIPAYGLNDLIEKTVDVSNI